MEPKLRIKLNDSHEYTAFLKYAYSIDDSLLFNEVYEQQPGTHKEPIIIAIVTALGGKRALQTIQAIIEAWVTHKAKIMDHELEMTKEKNRAEEARIELALKYPGQLEYKQISTAAFRKIDTVSSEKSEK
ncbi:hypothetical protein SAMN05444266_10987 [Chitinophaga jiangningensis]|uniref:Uncharacterized protein n=1 Tax=Chitinophaga jiangningensis TaxID=1419482 RepID=A0A1M7JZT7_9BACT|nr:hypothetical protein [Chitinophaga jiangningensis]SHM58498.1 hypothetical protein SAMN05444266_10987 [Chitinophaga jiangningensis]